MMHRFFNSYRALAFTACMLIMAGCALPTTSGGTPPSSAQQAITSTTVSYQALDAAILAADAAVKNGTLKGSDARNALKGLTDAKAGLDIALITLRSANAAAAATAASAASGVKP
jgi:hypothetical protein